MRIGLLSLSRQNLGDKIRTLKFHENLRDMGLDVTLINPLSSDASSSGGTMLSGISTLFSRLGHSVSKTSLGRTALFQRFAYDVLMEVQSRIALEMVRDKKIDLIQAETHTTAEIALAIKKKLGIPFFFDVHSVISPNEFRITCDSPDGLLRYRKKKEAEVMLNAEEIFVVSNPMKEYFESSYGLRNVTVIPNGSDPYPGLQKKYSIPLNVIYAGALDYWERTDDYLDAVKMMASRDYRFYLAGDGRLRESVLSRVRDEKLPVKYLGSLPRETLREILKRMHLGVVPEPNESHQRFNSSVKTFEYLSLGLPVVCANLGEPGQIVKECDCGILVPPEDSKAIADALYQYKDRELWTRHSRNGIKLIENRFSWKRIMERARPIYERYV